MEGEARNIWGRGSPGTENDKQKCPKAVGCICARSRDSKKASGPKWSENTGGRSKGSGQEPGQAKLLHPGRSLALVPQWKASGGSWTRRASSDLHFLRYSGRSLQVETIQVGTDRSRKSTLEASRFI